MKSLLIPVFTALLILYVIMFFVDHPVWPEATGAKIRNIFLALFAVYLSYNLVSIYYTKKDKEESAFVYKVASVSKSAYTMVSDYIRPFQKEFLIWLAVAVGVAGLSFILVGVPGFLLLEIPVKLGFVSRIQGDNAWPAGLYMSIIWPFCLPIGVLVKYYFIRHGYAPYALFGWIGTVVFGISFLITMTYWMFGKKGS